MSAPFARVVGPFITLGGVKQEDDFTAENAPAFCEKVNAAVAAREKSAIVAALREAADKLTIRAECDGAYGGAMHDAALSLRADALARESQP